MDLDPSGSWEERIDFCLGQAGRILSEATRLFIEEDGCYDESDCEAAAVLSEAWRDLAAAWQERQVHEVTLEKEMRDLMGDEEDDEDDSDGDGESDTPSADRAVRLRENREG